ncbi:MAG TPA: cellulose biosynthesis cyclic di-GMP-binding regulatory protein BcsB [Alcaligenes sp.]|nr:cellulose biosynthesis cyclic di-GMP-binding regulatory protein BcsB [Alcaligenes sp.]HRL27342.1 cellulose biosynthesis cyclic di-GMP-binding regulatory protein BcsB [Alcaligenes sp.]
MIAFLRMCTQVCAARCAALLLMLLIGAAAQASVYSVDFKALGRQQSMTLRGVDGWGGLWFGVRQDETVQALRLRLKLRHSEAMLPKLSHLNVRLNGLVIQTLPFKAEQGAKEQDYEVEIPVAQLQPLNQLQLQQIGHYTLSCEDPLHESLWTQIDDQSSLDFTVEPRRLPDDLAVLPAPFFDHRDSRPLHVTLVIPQRSQDAVQAAGVVASWLGALGSYRGVDFVVRDALPEQGAAIVLATAGQAGELAAGAVRGPTLLMKDNPNDGISKILLVSGTNDQELLTAARSLVTGSDALSGPVASGLVFNAQERRPYDAPNWVPSDRPVKFGELVDSPAMTVSGYRPEPISVALRLPPDLFPWQDQRVPMVLRYRPSMPVSDPSAYLAVDVNYEPVARLDFDQHAVSFRSLAGIDSMPLTERAIHLPLDLLATRATLGFSFQYPLPALKDCENLMVDNVRSSLDADSMLDLSGLPHFLAMPNAGAFMAAGFPFSRMADLSETAVVVSDDVVSADLPAYLGMMAKIGQSTGYPATRMQLLVNPTSPQGLTDKDILILSGGKTAALLEQWADLLPVPTGKQAPGYSLADEGVLLTGFRSPLNRSRNVVVLSAPSQLGEDLLPVLSDPLLEAKVQGSMVALSAGDVQVLSEQTHYNTGSLGWWRGLQHFLGGKPWLLALIFMGGISLASLLAYISLRARARSRLRIHASQNSE